MFRNLRRTALGISGHESEIIELALSHRFGGMDINMLEFSELTERTSLEHSRRLIDSAKIRIGGFKLPVDVTCDDDTFKDQLTRLTEIAKLAEAIECGCCRAVVEPACDDRPYHENFEFHRARLGQICTVLELHNVKLGLEISVDPSLREGKQHAFIQNYDALTVLVNTVGVENLGITLDMWAHHFSGGKTEDLHKLTSDQIVTVEAVDAPTPEDMPDVDEQRRLLPGETGVIDMGAVVKILAEMDYQGPVTPEPHRRRFKGMRRDAIARVAAESLEKVWIAAEPKSAPGKPAAAADSASRA